MLAAALAWPALTLGAATVRIIQTNAAGDSVMLIDPATNKVVGEIKDIEVNHGAAVGARRRRLYITNEAETTLDVADSKTLKVIKQIPLTATRTTSRSARTASASTWRLSPAPGAVDVIDTATLTRARASAPKGGIHNTYVTPDGKYVVAGSIPGKKITVIDQKTEETVWTLPTDEGVRPMAFEKNPDGSTKRMFVQLSDFNGFAIVDFDTQQGSRHGSSCRSCPRASGDRGPAGRAVARHRGARRTARRSGSLSKMNTRDLHRTRCPDLKLMGEAKVGHHPDWLTFTPDGKRVYVANAGSNSVSVVDIATRKELRRSRSATCRSATSPPCLP